MKKLNLTNFRIAIGLLIAVNLPTYAQQRPEPEKIQNGNFRYVAIGSSLSAGVRDGGIYAESQQTAFPALLAKQMGINNFKSPLLPGTGTGRNYVEFNRNGDINIKTVKGQYSDTKVPLPLISGSVDNLAIPFQKMIYSITDEFEQGAFPEGFDKRNYIHSNRYNGPEEKGASYLKVLNKNLEKADFFTYELGMDDFTSYYNSGGFRQDISAMVFDRETFFPEERILNILQSKGAKGVIINLPDMLSLPFYNYLSYDFLVDKLNRKPFIERFGKNDVRVAADGDRFLPTPAVLQSLKGVSEDGLTMEKPFKDEDVIGIEEVVSPEMYNKYLDALAKRYQFPLFDLHELYKQITENTYAAPEGITIDSKTFFSLDGITPSALGHSVITNELINTINKYNNTQIPLIQIKQ